MYKTITPVEAHKLLEEGYEYIDVRTVEEFDSGHVPGSSNIPIVHAGMRPNMEFVEIVEAHFPKDAKLVLGCKSGGRSARACEMLEDAGYTDLSNMDGGFHGRADFMGRVEQPGWLQEGFSVETQAGEGRDFKSLSTKE